MSTYTGTSHFMTFSHALSYYSKQGFDSESVHKALRDGDIHLGPPNCPQGCTVDVIRNEGRYVIVEP